MPDNMAASAQEVSRTPPKYPTVPEPSRDPASLQEAIVRLKEGYEMLTGQRGANEYSIVEGLTIIQKRAANSTARMYELNRLVTEANLALAERTTLIEAEILAARAGEVNLLARITQVDTARVTGDAALAISISTVEAKANSATAFGQVRLAARTTPLGGQSATYDVELTTNGAKAGLHIGAVGSDSVFAITASKFLMYDPSLPGNTPLQVMSYSGGKFIFTGDVAINGNLVISGTIDTLQLADDAVETPKILANAVSNAASNSGIISSGNNLDVILTTRAGAKVVIIAAVTNTTSTETNDGASNSLVTYGFDVRVDGVLQKSLFSMKVVAKTQFTGGSNYAFYRVVSPVSDHITVSGLSAGSHTFSINNGAGANVGLAITVIELAR